MGEKDACLDFQMATMRRPEMGGGSNAWSAVEDKSGAVTTQCVVHCLVQCVVQCAVHCVVPTHGSQNSSLFKTKWEALYKLQFKLLILRELGINQGLH